MLQYALSMGLEKELRLEPRPLIQTYIFPVNNLQDIICLLT